MQHVPVALVANYPDFDYQAKPQLTTLPINLQPAAAFKDYSLAELKFCLFDVLPNGQLITVTPDGHTVQLWSSQTGACIKTIATQMNLLPLKLMALSNRHFCLVYCHQAPSKDAFEITVTYWDSQTGQCLQRFTTDYHGTGEILALPNEQLAIGYINQVKVFKLTTGEQVYQLEHSDASSRRLQPVRTKLEYHYTGHLFAAFHQQQAFLASAYSDVGYEYENITFTAAWNIHNGQRIFASYLRKGVSDTAISANETLAGFPTNLAYRVWRPVGQTKLVNLPRVMMEYKRDECDVVYHDQPFKPLWLESLRHKNLHLIKPLADGSVVVNTKDGTLAVYTFPRKELGATKAMAEQPLRL